MRFSRYVWIKFRTMHSSGPSQWEYLEVAFEPEVPDEVNLKEALNEIGEARCTYSEHWRGVQGEIENPPVEYLEKHKRSLVRQAEEIAAAQVRAQALIDA